MYVANERNTVLVTYDSSFPCELKQTFKINVCISKLKKNAATQQLR